MLNQNGGKKSQDNLLQNSYKGSNFQKLLEDRSINSQSKTNKTQKQFVSPNIRQTTENKQHSNPFRAADFKQNLSPSPTANKRSTFKSRKSNLTKNSQSNSPRKQQKENSVIAEDKDLLQRSEQLFNQQSAKQKLKIFSEMQTFMKQYLNEEKIDISLSNFQKESLELKNQPLTVSINQQQQAKILQGQKAGMKDKSLDERSLYSKKQNNQSVSPQLNKPLGKVVHSPKNIVNIYVAPKINQPITERQKQYQTTEKNQDLIQDFGSFPVKEEIKNPTFNMDQNPFFYQNDSFKNEDTETKKSNQSSLDKNQELSEVRSQFINQNLESSIQRFSRQNERSKSPDHQNNQIIPIQEHQEQAEINYEKEKRKNSPFKIQFQYDLINEIEKKNFIQSSKNPYVFSIQKRSQSHIQKQQQRNKESQNPFDNLVNEAIQKQNEKVNQSIREQSLNQTLIAERKSTFKDQNESTLSSLSVIKDDLAAQDDLAVQEDLDVLENPQQIAAVHQDQYQQIQAKFTPEKDFIEQIEKIPQQIHQNKLNKLPSSSSIEQPQSLNSQIQPLLQNLNNNPQIQSLINHEKPIVIVEQEKPAFKLNIQAEKKQEANIQNEKIKVLATDVQNQFQGSFTKGHKSLTRKNQTNDQNNIQVNRQQNGAKSQQKLNNQLHSSQNVVAYPSIINQQEKKTIEEPQIIQKQETNNNLNETQRSISQNTLNTSQTHIIQPNDQKIIQNQNQNYKENLNNTAVSLAQLIQQMQPANSTAILQKSSQQVDMSIINQYEAALFLSNSEIQKLLMRNQQLQKENEMLKQSNIQLLAQNLNKFNNNNESQQYINANAESQNAANMWLNSQLKDARSQLFDLRHQIQNYTNEIRSLNEKRDLERKDLQISQEKLSESILNQKQLQMSYDQLKIETANLINTKQIMDKLQEQSEREIQILKKEIEFSEQQKLQQTQHILKIEKYNIQLKNCTKSMIDLMRSKGADENILKSYEFFLHEGQKTEFQNNFIEISPFAIQNSFQQFQFQQNTIATKNLFNENVQMPAVQNPKVNQLNQSYSSPINDIISPGLRNIQAQQNLNVQSTDMPIDQFQRNRKVEINQNQNQNQWSKPQEKFDYSPLYSEKIKSNLDPSKLRNQSPKIMNQFKQTHEQNFNSNYQEKDAIDKKKGISWSSQNHSNIVFGEYDSRSGQEANQRKYSPKPKSAQQIHKNVQPANNSQQAAMKQEQIQYLKKTISSLIEERRSLNNRLQNGRGVDENEIKRQIQIVTKNIETVQEKLNLKSM